MKQHIFLLQLLFAITNIIANTTDTTLTKCPSAIDSLDHCKVYTVVEEFPKFPNGEAALQRYLSNRMQAANLDCDMYSKIVIEFITDTLGKARNACVTMTYSNQIVTCKSQDELLKAINEMPLWEPGKLAGKKVYTRITFPVRVHLKLEK